MSLNEKTKRTLHWGQHSTRLKLTKVGVVFSFHKLIQAQVVSVEPAFVLVADAAAAVGSTGVAFALAGIVAVAEGSGLASRAEAITNLVGSVPIQTASKRHTHVSIST